MGDHEVKGGRSVAVEPAAQRVPDAVSRSSCRQDTVIGTA